MSTFDGTLMTTGFRVKDLWDFKADPVIQYYIELAEFTENLDTFGAPIAMGWRGDYPSAENEVFTDVYTCTQCDYELITNSVPNPEETITQHIAEAHQGRGDYLNGEKEVWYSLFDAIQQHIHPDDVCILQVSGHEGLQYLGGVIGFITDKGTVCFPYGQNDWQTTYHKKGIYDRMAVFINELKEILTNDQQPPT